MNARSIFLLLLMLAPAVGVAAPAPGIPDGWSDSYFYANGALLPSRNHGQRLTFLSTCLIHSRPWWHKTITALMT